VSLNIVDILSGCRLFSGVDPRGFQRLATIARLCHFEKGEIVFRDGQDCPGVYVVGSGLVRVFKTGATGKEHVLHMIGPGNTFAEVAAIGGLRCPASAEAVVATTCVLLPLAPFRNLLETDHDLCREMMVGMAAWVRHLIDLIEDVVLRDAAGRLARYLLNAEADASGVVELPTLKRHVASHLNLTSETLSRTIRRLAEAGLIAEPDPGHVQLLDCARLRQVAEGMIADV
jgi:CRP/FNR family transcriptional regulator